MRARDASTIKLFLIGCVGVILTTYIVYSTFTSSTDEVQSDKEASRVVDRILLTPDGSSNERDGPANEANGSGKEGGEKHPLRKRLPDAMVIGAGKCGTDALITYLNTSSSFLVNTIVKDFLELNYFNKNYEKGTQWYISQMPLARDNQILIEKCAPYLWDPQVPPRVHMVKPDMKLIVVLCDPVKRLVSLYSHINSYKLVDGSDPLPPFTEIINIKDGRLIETVHWRSSMPFLETGKYSVFISQWLKYFSLDQMIFISGEELIKSPLTQVGKVTEFLGRPGAITNNNVYFDTDRGYYCFRSHDGVKWCMDKSTKGRKHPDLSPELLKALQDHFEQYNRELENMVGVKFGWPKYFGKKN